MTALETYTRILRGLATELAQEETVVQEGPEAGSSLWSMLSERQQAFFADQKMHRAHVLIVEGAHDYQAAQDASSEAA